MSKVSSDLQTEGDFSPDKWTHEMIWDHEVHVIHQCLVAKQRQTLVTSDREFEINKGERLVAVNNFKYAPEDFQGLCEDSGFTVNKSVQHNTMNLVHLGV